MSPIKILAGYKKITDNMLVFPFSSKELFLNIFFYLNPTAITTEI